MPITDLENLKERLIFLFSFIVMEIYLPHQTKPQIASLIIWLLIESMSV